MRAAMLRCAASPCAPPHGAPERPGTAPVASDADRSSCSGQTGARVSSRFTILLDSWRSTRLHEVTPGRHACAWPGWSLLTHSHRTAIWRSHCQLHMVPKQARVALARVRMSSLPLAQRPLVAFHGRIVAVIHATHATLAATISGVRFRWTYRRQIRTLAALASQRLCCRHVSRRQLRRRWQWGEHKWSALGHDPLLTVTGLA